MDIASLHKISQNFTNELIASEKGEKTSLAFIKNTIPSSPLVKDGETFQVMVIGGTNFTSALVKKSANTFEIIKMIEDKVPIFTTEEVFFKYISSYLEKNIKYLSINFGYGMEPTFIQNKLDGILVEVSKEHLFEGLLFSSPIGEKITAYIKSTYNKGIAISIANDTICLLLSGKTQISETNLAAGIVGTGLNFAILLDNTTLVNLEAGAFDKYPRSREGISIDNASSQVGINIFEKEISGGYLYKHFNLALAENNIKFPPLTNTEQLSILAEERQDEIGTLAQETLERSAQLVACTVAGIVKFKKSDMTFVMQGSVFWKGYQYKETVAETVKKLSPEYTVNFIKVEHADILGAAKLVA